MKTLHEVCRTDKHDIELARFYAKRLLALAPSPTFGLSPLFSFGVFVFKDAGTCVGAVSRV